MANETEAVWHVAATGSRRRLWKRLAVAVPVLAGIVVVVLLLVASDSTGTPEALGKRVFKALSTADERLLLSTLLDEEAVRGLAQREAQSRHPNDPAKQREHVEQQIARFREQYPGIRAKYLDDFSTARQTGPRLGIDWAAAELNRVDSGSIQEGPTGKYTNRITIQFGCGDRVYAVRLSRSVQTASGWRTTRLGVPELIFRPRRRVPT